MNVAEDTKNIELTGHGWKCYNCMKVFIWFGDCPVCLAKLIRMPATGVELLDAVRDTYDDLVMFTSGEWDGEQFGGLDSTLDKLHAAITKAEVK